MLKSWSLCFQSILYGCERRAWVKSPAQEQPLIVTTANLAPAPISAAYKLSGTSSFGRYDDCPP